MKEIHKPQTLVLVTNLGLMFCALAGLALWISCPSFGLKTVGVMLNSLLVVIAVLQCVLYLKNYVDYRLNEIELNKSVKSA